MRKGNALASAVLVTAIMVVPQQVAAVTVSETPLQSPMESPGFYMNVSPDGELWYTTNYSLVRVPAVGPPVRYLVPTPGGPRGLTFGPDGRVWFTIVLANDIGRMTPAGAFSQTFLPTADSLPLGITTGPDGNLWFTEMKGRIGRITTDGQLVEFPTLTADAEPRDITRGRDGNLWFTQKSAGGGHIVRITPDGVMTEFPVPSPNSEPAGITTGPDGNLWFTDLAGSRIGKATLAGVVTEYETPSIASGPRHIVGGSDGNLWFTENTAARIGRVTINGVITEYPVPSMAAPWGITRDSDGNIRFTEPNGASNGTVTDDAFGPSCPAAPLDGCWDGGRSRLAIDARGETTELAWRWSQGEDGSGDFGDPATPGSRFTVCIYDAPGTSPSLAMDSFVESGGTCDELPCWSTVNGKAWTYRNRTGTGHGITSVKMNGGNVGKPRLSLRMRGGAIPSPAPGSYFHEDPAVTVQIRNASTGGCWSSTFGDSRENTTTVYRASGR